MERHSRATHHYFDRQFGVPAVKLLASEYYVGAGDLVLTTVLGSCVSACLFDLGAGVGGMNHFMLPGEAEDAQPGNVDTRYGGHAMEVLVAELLRAGARRERLTAKVFGGGAVLPGMTQLNIGERNTEFALQYLRRHEVPVMAQDVGGTLPRRIGCFPGSGRVAVHTLRRQEDLAEVQQNEQRLIGLAPPAAPGSDAGRG
ncbi:chemoreceptor glutamine deamidase CheD [Ramlibacter tataouinensis]|uniref:chemoreceptor glutamine deamidase CheD n=1 Tax=Ramlibacter tataouinensis TaxID=94132 RepID=UPI0022F38B63|nr:chemoreceptor glutamine deamidase CheD [Ramlibacter tataouinensis]WBY00580.1 chemoreceptor glutamine deamidase CheD [Ramlibacter tataouinensis]